MLKKFNLNLDELYDLIIHQNIKFIDNIHICKCIFDSLLFYQIDNINVIGQQLLIRVCRKGMLEIIKYLHDTINIQINISTSGRDKFVSYASLIDIALLHSHYDIVKYLNKCEDNVLHSFINKISSPNIEAWSIMPYYIRHRMQQKRLK